MASKQKDEGLRAEIGLFTIKLLDTYKYFLLFVTTVYDSN